MQKYILLILSICFVCCENKQDKNSRFTEKQIASLHLDSTKILKVETDSVTTINLNPFLKKQAFDFGSLIEEVKLVALETTDESLVDDIYKVLVTESNIYIYDDFKGGGIVIFNSEGKFIKRISNGSGPGELVRLYDMDFDKEKNELIAYQHSFLLFFSPSGEFIRQMRLPFGFYNFTVTSDGYVFKALDEQGNGHLGLLEDYTLFVTDKNFKLKSVGLPCVSSNVNLGGYNYLYNNTTSLHVTQKYTDTIYQYVNESNQLKAEYILDYSKKKLPEIYLKGTKVEFDHATKQDDYYFYLGQYLETEYHHIFFLENRHIVSQTVVYRDKKSGNLKGGTSANFNWNEIPPIGFPKTASGDYFVSVHLTNKNDTLLSNSSVISEEDKLKINNLTEDDNPILVFFKLKDF
ncbi:6-bladed beta-propeller [Viscerimonas tarda]